jgi:hypothetical protein
VVRLAAQCDPRADAPEALIFSILLTDYEQDRLREAAKAMGVSTDELVSELVHRALNNKMHDGRRRTRLSAASRPIRWTS